MPSAFSPAKEFCMLKNPTAAQLEEIRRDGKTGSYIAQWGYHAVQEAKVFLLEVGEALPKGWFKTPVRADELASEPAPVEIKPEEKAAEPVADKTAAAKPDAA
jgi:hypothetical protein